MSGGPLVIGTAGHVDHGKTALVKALTGRDTDRLPEERSRGISIELGFAPLMLPSGRTVSLVDVPGHERFVRHMVAGASGIDGYLLCVAADDGVMPQTREHVDVLRLLGVHRGVVAITKADLIEPDLAEEEVRELLGEGPEIVAVSAIRGEGVADLVAALDRLASGLARRTAVGRPRLFVDRSFTITGAGTVVTGTLWGGPIAVGERVRLIPGDTSARVRGVQVHDRPAGEASGGRVALNLAGVERGEVERGACVVRAEDVWVPSARVDVALDWLPEAGGPLRTRRRLQAFLGTTEIPATCVLLSGDEILPADRGYAQLRLEGLLAVDEGDRIVLRSAERRTVGGATVLDAHPPRHGRGARQAERLAILDRGDAAARAALRLREAGGEGIPLGEATRLDGEAIVLGDRVVHEAVVEKARAAIVSAVGDDEVSLAAAVDASGLAAGPAEALVEELVASGAIGRDGARLVRPGRERDREAIDRVAAVLVDAGLRPPGLTELVGHVDVGQGRVLSALVALEKEGRVAKAGDLWFDAGAAAAARERAAQALAAGPLGLGELRDLWGVGRRHAMALAAHLDQVGLTRRQGDVRVLRRGAAR